MNMSDTEQATFANRLRDALKQSRFSRKQFCALCDISEMALSRYLSGERQPKADVLANMANALKTTVDYLLGTDEHYDYERLKIVLAKSKDDLSKNQKEVLLKLLMEEYERD